MVSGREETSERGVKPARVEEINAEAGFFMLTREVIVRAEIAESIPRFSKGFVKRGGGLCAVRVRGDTGTAEVVREQEAQRPIRADGETRGTSEVEFRDNAVFHFIMIANVDGGDPIHGGFDLLAIAIIDETRGRRACHRDEAIPPQGRFAVGIVVEGVVFEFRPFEDVTRGHTCTALRLVQCRCVAVLVVAVGVAVREGRHRVFVSRIIHPLQMYHHQFADLKFRIN